MLKIHSDVFKMLFACTSFVVEVSFLACYNMPALVCMCILCEFCSSML